MRVVDLALEDPRGDWLDRWTPEELLRTVTGIGANVLDMMVVNEWGQAYFETRHLPKHPKLGRRDLLEEVLEAAAGADIRVTGMWGPSSNPAVYEEHPDWAHRDADGTIPWWNHPDLDPWIILCHNSPYAEFVLTVLDDLFARYAIDGIAFDLLVWRPCFCDHCRSRFRADTGMDLGQRESWSEADYRAHADWCRETMAQWMSRVRLLCEHHGRALISWGPWGHVTFAEPHMGDYITIRDKGYHVRRTVAAGRLRDQPTVICTPYAHMYFIGLPKPPAQMRQEFREIVISGASPWPVIWDWEFVKDKRGFPPLGQVYAEMRASETLLARARPLRYAALLLSEQTAEAPSGPDRLLYDRVKGFYDAVTAAHMPLEIILDGDLTPERLRGFSVLILPNARCLSDAQAAAVDDFVRCGGGLVATYETSLARQTGEPRPDFALDCLGCSLKGAFEGVWTYVRITREHPATMPLEPGFSLLHGYYTAVQGEVERLVRGEVTTIEALCSPSARQLQISCAPECEVLATIQQTSKPRESNFLKDVAPGTPGADTAWPAIVARRAGRGRVVYVAGQLDLVAYNVGHPDYDQLLASAVMWAGGEPPVQILAPRTVEAAFYECDSGQRLLVHLLNHSYDQLFSVPRPGKNEQTPGVGRAITEVVPVRDICLTVAAGDGTVVKRAVARNAGRELPVERQDERARVVVGGLHEYELVEILIGRH